MADLLRAPRGGAARKPPGTGSSLSSSSSSVYDDVFGGPPRYSGPFAARMGDYSEIFGGLASSCSIPVLDLPPALDACEARVDYFEIFGCFDGDDIGPTYEELVAAEAAAAAAAQMESGSPDSRVPRETEVGHQTREISESSPYGADKNHVASRETELGQQTSEISEFSPEKDQISSSGKHLDDDCSTQLNMSYHKTSRGNIKDAINETPQMPEFHVISGFTSDTDGHLAQSTGSDGPPNIGTSDLSLNVNLNGKLCDQKQGDTFSPSSSADSTKSFGIGLKTDLKHTASKFPTSVDGPADLKHHSRSSSNHSISSGDMYYPDFTYVTVSDISLRTQPVPVPPPSRTPPKLANNQEINKMDENSETHLDEASLTKPILNRPKHSGRDAPKRRAPQVPTRENSFFFDVEVDVSSAAAASAAAMKEAMEQAQARLKSAKESMERKRETFPSRKKLGHSDGSKSSEQKDVKAAQVKILSEAVNQKTFMEEEKKKNEFALEERQKTRGAAKVAPDYEGKERHVVFDEHDQHKMLQNGFISSPASYKLVDRTGEWKTDKQFYELVHNEKKFKVVKEPSDKKFTNKIPKETTQVDKEKEDMSNIVETSYEFERKGDLLEVHKSHIREDKKSKAGDTTFLEEKKEAPNTIPEILVPEENVRILEVRNSHQPVEDESKLEGTQEAQISGEEVKKPNNYEDAPARKESEVKPTCPIDAHDFGVSCENKEKERMLETSKEVSECVEYVALSHNYVTCQPHDNENKMGTANRTEMQIENGEIKVPYASCMWESGEKAEAAAELSQCENSEKTREKTTLECDKEENVKPSIGTIFVSEHHENRKLNMTEEASMLVGNDLKFKVSEEANKMEENLEELKAAEGGIRSRKKERIDVAKGDEYEENKTREAQIELQHDGKKQTPAEVPCGLENTEVLTVAVQVHQKKENENIREVHVDKDVKEKYSIFNVAQELFRRIVNKDVVDFQETKLLKKEGKMLSSSQNTAESSPSLATEQTAPDMQTLEEKEKERRTPLLTEQTAPDMRKLEEREKERHTERELEKERKLEEDREREREREKDRIAVERATREAHETAYAEVRERAERIVVERVTAEARQRALAEAREKAEKASAEALEKSSVEKASRDARVKAERAAVDRATAEARGRAVERALADKAAADARERAEKLNASSSKDRMRRDNEKEEHSRASSKGDTGSRGTYDPTPDTQYKNVSSSSSDQWHNDSYNQGEDDSPLRCKARSERHQRTVQRAEKALAEKNKRDILAQREQAERNRLAETLDADVRRWSTGKEGNLRALLSTLQYILGPESGWQPIPLTDVITAAAAKKAYRKATLCVHPDKLQQRRANIQQKYICEKVFDLLKDAWIRFNSEER